MKRIFAAAVFVLLLSGIAHAAFGIFQTYAGPPSNPNLRQENVFGLTGSAWQDTANYYVPGTGNPAVSTADYYHSNGVYGIRPYDLTAAECGSAGAAIAAARGRFAWIIAPDHGQGGDTVWNGSFDYRIGYTNDPGVLPSRATFVHSIQTVTATAPIATFTGSISGTTLTAGTVSGLITNDNHATLSGSGVTGGTAITSQLTGTSGEAGTYAVSPSQTAASTAMTASQANYFIYQDPQLVCNPDDAMYPFYIYSEGSASGIQHEHGFMRSTDLLTWTAPLPSHVTLTFGGWSSFQRVNRASAGVWESVGYQVGYPQNGGAFSRGKWTSADGIVWDPGSITLNNCIPASAQIGTTTGCTGTGVLTIEALGSSPYSTTIGAAEWMMSRISTVNNNVREGHQWVGRVPIDSNGNVIDSPSHVNVSAAYDGIYPGPNYLQAITGYVGDGIAHYYALRGWPISSQLWFMKAYARYENGGVCATVPVVNGAQGQFQVTGSISGTTLTVTSIPLNSVYVGGQLFGGGISSSGFTYITAQLTGSPGGIGTYTVSVSQTVSGTFNGAACGGLLQQGLDYYTEIIDATAAASAAPVGVRASCAAGTASLVWYDALPHQNYRVYRGTSAGSQPTLVGDVTGTSTTNAPGSDGVFYYKVVTINGTEQGSRVVSTYCSSSSAFVNAHMTRALADGADPTTCNRTFMDTFDAWLVSNSLSNNLLFATMADFCVKGTTSGAGAVTKVYDMGTTRLPRGGDYTTMTSGVTYNATGVGSKPAWVNAANTDRGYYGGDRAYLNNIRRKTEITLFAAYQKPGTAQFMALASGQFTNRLYLSHDSGTPGTISCSIYDATQAKIATATPASATAFNTAACTYDATNGWIAYANAVAGTPQTGLVIPSPDLNPPDALTGQIGSGSLTNVLVSGDAAGLYNRTSGAFSSQGNLALANNRAIMIFDKALTDAQVTSLDALMR